MSMVFISEDYTLPHWMLTKVVSKMVFPDLELWVIVHSRQVIVKEERLDLQVKIVFPQAIYLDRRKDTTVWKNV